MYNSRCMTHNYYVSDNSPQYFFSQVEPIVVNLFSRQEYNMALELLLTIGSSGFYAS
jgi:hypothetical protein